VQVRSYKKLVRSFPANVVLNILGYEAINAEYTEYDAPSTAPQNLFNRG
jgi:LemA protein